MPKSSAQSREQTARPVKRQDRADKHVVAAHFETAAYRDFKRLAADELKSTDVLIHEAVALLFKHRHRPVPPAIMRKLEKLGIK